MSLRASLYRRWGYARGFVAQGQPVFLAAGIATLVLAVAGLLAAPLCDLFRWAGLALQLIGLGIVVHGLDGLRVRLGKESIGALARQWVLLLVRIVWLPRARVVSGVGLASGMSMTARARARVLRGEAGDIEERLVKVEMAISDIYAEIDVIERETEDRFSYVNARLRDHSQEIKKQAQSARKVLEDVSLGGFAPELAGVAYLIAGIVLATVPLELAMFLSFWAGPHGVCS